MIEQETVRANSSHIKEPPYDPFVEWYVSVVTDYVYKATIATVVFFACCPWAALFWPPYYLTRRSSK
jgi:hypothetical protein